MSSYVIGIPAVDQARSRTIRTACLLALLALATALLATATVAIAKPTPHKPKKDAVYSNCRRVSKKKRKHVCIPNESLRTNKKGNGLYALWTTKCSSLREGYPKNQYPVKIKKNGRFAGTTPYYTTVGNQLSNTFNKVTTEMAKGTAS